MKIFKNLWFLILLSLTVGVVLLFVLMNRFLHQQAGGAHHAKHAPESPTSPVKYPGKLTDELRDFVAELEKRDAAIREKAEDLQSIRNSIEQETKEFEQLKTEVINLQAQFDRNVQDLKSKYILFEQKEQDNYRNLAGIIESLSPSAAVTLLLQMNKDMDQEPPAPYK